MLRFAVTEKGYFVLVPRGTWEGDEIVLSEKACVPFVVHKKNEDGVDSEDSEPLGESYVHES